MSGSRRSRGFMGRRRQPGAASWAAIVVLRRGWDAGVRRTPGRSFNAAPSSAGRFTERMTIGSSAPTAWPLVSEAAWPPVVSRRSVPGAGRHDQVDDQPTVIVGVVPDVADFGFRSSAGRRAPTRAASSHRSGRAEGLICGCRCKSKSVRFPRPHLIRCSWSGGSFPAPAGRQPHKQELAILAAELERSVADRRTPQRGAYTSSRLDRRCLRAGSVPSLLVLLRCRGRSCLLVACATWPICCSSRGLLALMRDRGGRPRLAHRHRLNQIWDGSSWSKVCC